MSFLPRAARAFSTLCVIALFAACSEPRKITSVALSPASLSLAAGTHGKLVATATFNDKTTEDVTTRATWAVSDAAKATVAAGEVSALAAGTANVTATVDGLAGTAALTVTAAELVSLEVTPPAAALAKGTTAQLAATGTFSDGTHQELTNDVTWTAGDATLATVSAAGLVTGVAAGASTVRASKGEISASASVIVTDAKLTKLVITAAEASIAKGTKTHLVATGTFTDQTTQDLTSIAHWATQAPEIVQVSDEAGTRGEVKGLGVGDGAVTATIGEVTARFTVTVRDAALESVAISPPALALAKGTEGDFALTATFSDGSTQDVTADATWASDAAETAAVSTADGSRGHVQALLAGHAGVTASYGGKDAHAAVEVTAATLVKLSIDPAAPQLAKGTKLALTATGVFTDGSSQNLTSTVTWTSADEDVAHVSNAAGTNGLATALAEGDSEITVQLVTVTAKVTLHVSAATLESIQVAPAGLALPKGTSDVLVATGVFSDGSRQVLTADVTWASADETIATVSNAAGEEGKVSALAEGATTVTATVGAVHGEAAVAVSSARLTGLAISPANGSVPRGRTLGLTATGTYSDGSTRNVTSAATWSTTDSAIATVSNADGTVGLLTGAATGAVTVKAQLGGQTAEAQVTVTAATLVSIALGPVPATLAKATTLAMTATGTYSDGTTADITAAATWSSSDATIAAVANAGAQKGLVSGLLPGAVTVTAQLDGKTGLLPVTVTAARLTNLAISPASATLAKGTSKALTLTATFGDGSHQNVTTLATWSSSAAAVAVSNVDGSVGTVTATAAGEADVTASYGGQTATAHVTATAAQLVSLAIAPAAVSLPQGTTAALQATGTYSDGTTQVLTDAVNWTTDDAAVATVSMAAASRGTLSAVARGTTTIRAKSGSIEATLPVTVTAGVLSSIAITSTGTTVVMGFPLSLTATGTFTDGSTQNLTSTVTWTSSDESVIVVANETPNSGRIATISPGTATVTASFGGKTASIGLTVTAAQLRSISVSPPAATFAKGTTKQLAATGSYSDGSTQDLTTQVTWASADATIADVSMAAGSEGKVTGAGEGAVQITAKIGTMTGRATMNVTAATLQSLGVTPISPTIASGNKLAMVATGTFSDGSKQDLSSLVAWSTSDAAIVDVSNAPGSRGLVTALAAGTSTVKAKLGTVEATTLVTVSSAVLQSIAISPALASVAKGTTKQLAATGLYSDGTTQDLTKDVTWGTDDAATATVSNAASTKGLLRGAAVGDTKATATLGGITGTADVKVTAALLTAIDVTPATVSVPKGLTKTLVATGTYTDGSKQDVTGTATWSSADPAKVDVSNAAADRGTVTALGLGSAAVTATVGTVSGSATVTVTAATLVSIGLTPATPKLANGTKLSLQATGVYTDGSHADVTGDAAWKSLDTTVADVSSAAGSAGEVRGMSVGTATISATIGTVSATVSVEVTAAVLASIVVSPAGDSFAKGTTKQLHADGIYTDGTHQDLTALATWTSTANIDVSNAATFEGLATALTVGAGTVTASYAGVSGSAALDVTAAVLRSISIAPASPTIPRGTMLAMHAFGIYSDGSSDEITTSVAWSTSDGTVASVSNGAGHEGEVTGVKVGTATITAKSGTILGSVSVEVTAPTLSRIDITPASQLIAKGRTQQMTATAVYADGTTADVTTQATWSSDDTSIVTISNGAGTNGLATGVGQGSGVVRASFGGQSAWVFLDVNPAEMDTLEISATSSSVPKGRTVPLTATGHYSDGTTQDQTLYVTWTVADTNVLSVASQGALRGQAKGLSLGTTTVRATLSATTSPPLTLTVTAAVLTKLTVSPASASVAKGTTQAFTVSGDYSDGSTADLTTQATWTSSDTTVASITTTGAGAGVATGLVTGTSNVTATLTGVTSTPVTLTVTPATLVSIAINPATFTIAAGTAKQLAAVGTYTDGTTQDITTTASWSSSATGVATVSNGAGARGLVSGVAAGTANITATLSGVTSPVSQATVTPPAASCKTIVINEMMTGINGGASAEMVELKNKCATDVDLSGWKIIYRGATSTTDSQTSTIAAGITIPAGGYLLFATSAWNTAFPGKTIAQTFTFGFAAGGGGLQLRDPSATAIDSVAWGTATNAFIEGTVAPAPTDAASPGRSLIRSPDGVDTDNNLNDFKVTTKPTAGAVNELQ